MSAGFAGILPRLRSAVVRAGEAPQPCGSSGLQQGMAQRCPCRLAAPGEGGSCAADTSDLPLTPAQHVSLYQPAEQMSDETPG